MTDANLKYPGNHAQEPKFYIQYRICGPSKFSFIERGKPVYDDHVTLNSWDQPGGLQS